VGSLDGCACWEEKRRTPWRNAGFDGAADTPARQNPAAFFLMEPPITLPIFFLFFLLAAKIQQQKAFRCSLQTAVQENKAAAQGLWARFVFFSCRLLPGRLFAAVLLPRRVYRHAWKPASAERRAWKACISLFAAPRCRPCATAF